MEFGDSVIGRSVRLPGWTNCVIIIEDVGEHSFWGVLRDIKEERNIEIRVGKFDEPWMFALEVEDIISNMN
jgi:hypothetical protein